MKVSKIIKSDEFKNAVDSYIRVFAHGKDWEAKKVREDLNRLMDYLKIEFQDVPSVPSKRIVAKKKKSKKNHNVTIPNTTAQVLAAMQQAAAYNSYPDIMWRQAAR